MTGVRSILQPPFNAFAWPGGYPVVYLEESTNRHLNGHIETACGECATVHYYAWLAWALHTDADGENVYGDWEPDYVPIAAQVHYEGAPEGCSECNAEIESAYGEPDAEQQAVKS